MGLGKDVYNLYITFYIINYFSDNKLVNKTYCHIIVKFSNVLLGDISGKLYSCRFTQKYNRKENNLATCVMYYYKLNKDFVYVFNTQ